MKAWRIATLLTLAASMPLAAQAPAPRPTETQANTQRSKAPADSKWVIEAAQGGMAEVELGKLASDKAANADVKQFGQRMATDHQKANDELKTVAQQKNITLPAELDAKHKADVARLSKLSGDAFDRAYMKMMLADHRADVSKFKMESQSGKDPDVKAFAAKTLPTLEEHLKQAESANKAVATSGTTKPTPKSTTGTTKK
jgi:putative membrane protein